MEKHFMIRYLSEKLLGASFSISVIFIIIFISSDFNLFEFHEFITNPEIWILFFGYGISSSMIIDVIGKYIPDFSKGKQLLLYLLFGYLLFFFLMPIEYVFIAGTVGAFFSFLFLLGKELLKPFKWYSWIACIVPLVCLVMLPFDYTSKVGWNEVRGDSSVEVTYAYFNGEHLIPIHGKQNEKFHFEIEHHFRQGDSYGVSLYDKHGDYAGMKEENDEVLSFTFETSTTKYIVVNAINGSQGQFQVKWWRAEEEDTNGN